MFEQVFGDMGEGDSIEAKSGNMWERIEKIFSLKKSIETWLEIYES